MKNLMKYFKDYRLQAVLSPLFKLAEALMELSVPMVVALIIDQIAQGLTADRLIRYIAYLFLIALSGWALALCAQYFAASASVGFTKNLTQDFFQHVIRLAQKDQDKISKSGLLTRLTSDTQQIQTGLNILFRLIMRSPFIVFGSFMMALHIDARLSMAFLAMIGILGVVVGGIIYFSNPLYQKIQQHFERLILLATEQIQGIRVIRAFRQEDREIEAFDEQDQRLKEEKTRAAYLAALTNPMTYLVVNISLIMIIWQGGRLIQVGQLTQGQLVALINYLLAILVELVKMVMVMTTFNKGLVSAKRISKVLEIPTEDLSLLQVETDFPADFAFSFNKVSFAYPTGQAEAVREINFTVEDRQFIGIVGGTGSGKSTLVQLLTQTYEPTQGQILYDPGHFNTHDKLGLRSEISLVPQKAQLFKGTIRSNLLMANAAATDDQMWEALEIAQAADFVRHYDLGLDHPVEAFGRNFSGGQRQRLTIARALVKPSALIIFDDSTSALDYLTESKLLQAVRAARQDSTLLMISQRTHSIKEADQIVVLDEGQQVGLGRHQELLAESAIYQEIHQSQQVGEDNQDD